MQQHHLCLQSHIRVFPQPYWVATDSIGTVSDPVPVHPEDKHPSFDEFKQKNKRKPHPEQSPEESNGKHPDPDHQIDEYA